MCIFVYFEKLRSSGSRAEKGRVPGNFVGTAGSHAAFVFMRQLWESATRPECY